MNDDVLRAVERVRDGETISAAARAEGTHFTSVWRGCKKLGVHSPRALKVPTLEMLAALLNTDAPLSEIAQRFGVSVSQVGQLSRTARQAGIRVPVKRRRASE